MTETHSPTDDEILAATPHADEKHDNLHGPTDKQFIVIFVVLAVVTSVEVAISYADIGPLFLPVLLLLMVAKFFGVVWYFMHVKFDHQLFGRLFYIGLGLAAGVYVIMLTTFRFFGA
ncbi:MAG: cytochrome C oxidase subunit IV family protein [Ilumatobacter sp.]|nr:cytochrome C oxidase subunit IV family protein [Ilumatobacter sp.]